jgi:hypothetical protein
MYMIGDACVITELLLYTEAVNDIDLQIHKSDLAVMLWKCYTLDTRRQILMIQTRRQGSLFLLESSLKI